MLISLRRKNRIYAHRICTFIKGSIGLFKNMHSSYMYEGYGGTENSACVSITSR